MKKLFAIIVSALLTASLTACGIDSYMAGADNGQEVSENESVADIIGEDDGDELFTVSVADESEVEIEEESEAESKVAKDLSDMKNPFVIGAVAVEVPEGFSLDDEESYGAQIAVPDDYPTHSDNVTFYETDVEEDMELYSKESIIEQYSAALDGFTDIDVYEQYDIDGIPAIKTSYSVVIQDVPMVQTQVIVFYDGGTCAITYTSVSGDFDDAFEESIESITAAYE